MPHITRSLSCGLQKQHICKHNDDIELRQNTRAMIYFSAVANLLEIIVFFYISHVHTFSFDIYFWKLHFLYNFFSTNVYETLEASFRSQLSQLLCLV